VGAAAAGARFLGLDAERATHAISMSTSMAAGFMSQFGTMTKPLHAGLAAKAGVMATGLAEAGMTAGRETLDSPTGMNRLMVGQDYEEQRDALTHIEHGQTLRFETEQVGDPLLILSSGLKVKRFPNCASTHRSLDGLLAIREEHGLRPDMVARVEAWLPVTHYNNLMHHDAGTGLEAKFSLEYALAVGLVSGHCTLQDFSTAAVMRPEVRALYGKLAITPVDKPEGEFPTRIRVTLQDGRRFEKSIAMPVGSIAAPFTTAQYWEKFSACVQDVMAGDDIARLRRALEDLPGLPSIAPLMAPLQGPFLGHPEED
jgi:2-methylcitrate dehydratase PrpD